MAIVLVLLLLMIGIWGGFCGILWARYLAFAAFGVLFLMAMLNERFGWRRVERTHAHRRLPLLRRPRRIRPASPPVVVATSHRERMRTRPPDVLEQAGSWFLAVVVMVVLLGGCAWILTIVAHG